MPRRGRTLKSKFVAVAGIGVFGGLALSVTVSVLGAQRLREQSSREVERGLTEASQELVRKHLDDIGRSIERLIGPTLADLNVATEYAQGLLDAREALAPLNAAARKIPSLTPPLLYRDDGGMLQNAEGHPTIIGVWDSVLGPEKIIPPKPRAVLEDTVLLDPMLSALAKHGTSKLQMYFVGPKDHPVLRMAPYVDIAAVWHQLYPGASAKPFYGFFFPGLVEAWERLLADPEAFALHRADAVMWPPYEDAAGGGLIVTFFRPLWSQDRRGFVGSIGVDITLAEMVASIAQVRLGKSGFAFLLEGDGNLLAISEEGATKLALSASEAPAEGVKQLRRVLAASAEPELAKLAADLPKDDETHVYQVSLGGEPHLLALRRGLAFDIARTEAGPQREHWTAGVVISRTELFGPLLASQAVIQAASNQIMLAQIAGSLLTLFAVLAGIFVMARRMTAPLSDLTHAAREIQQRNYAVQVPEARTNDEIAELTTAFNAMAAESREHTENLERLVKQRTADLDRTLAELWSEMDLARKIQTVLLPGDAEIPGYDVAAVMNPASDVGGDYYDYFEAGGARWLLIGDVSGHGVSSGLIMMMMQTAIRATTESLAQSGRQPSPSEVLSLVNASIRGNFEKIGDGKYMTITALRLEQDRIRFAGLHQDLLIRRAATGAIERVPTTGVWVGLLDEIGPFLEDESFTLEAGDVLLLYTDGLTEARVGGTMLGLEGLEAALERALAEGPEPPRSRQLVERILRQLPTQSFEDDITLIAVQRS